MACDDSFAKRPAKLTSATMAFGCEMERGVSGVRGRAAGCCGMGLQGLFNLAGIIVPRLPRKVAYVAASAGGIVAFFANGRGRAVLMENIGTLLDLPPESPRLRSVVRNTFCCHAKNYVDLFYLRRMSLDDVRDRTAVRGVEYLARALEGGRGAVLATAHLGNVEYGGHGLIAHIGMCSVLTEPVEPAWLLDFFTVNRAMTGGIVIPYHSGVLPQLIATLKRNIPLGIACDWDMQGNGVQVACAGKTLMMPAGLAVVALRARSPILPVFTARLPDNRIEISVEPPLDVPLTGKVRDDAANLLQELASVLGRRLLRYPGQWVLFHRAWAKADR
jgi:KDO2-lipid IV(A) lauroyltransferase